MYIIGTSMALFSSVVFFAMSALKSSQLLMSLSTMLNILRSTAPVFGHRPIAGLHPTGSLSEKSTCRM